MRIIQLVCRHRLVRVLGLYTIILALITSSISIDSASSSAYADSQYPYGYTAKELYSNHPYNVPPRLFHNCMDSYIGNEYSEARRPSCERLWGMWTREIILDETEYFSTL